LIVQVKIVNQMLLGGEKEKAQIWHMQMHYVQTVANAITKMVSAIATKVL
jgi:hypothetical protein